MLFTGIKRLYSYIAMKFKKQSLKILSASLSADGSLINISYHVARPDKIKRDLKISLIEEESQLQLEMARASKNAIIKSYNNSDGILLFHNKNNKIKYGSCVTLLYGNLKAEHIKVT